MRVTVKLRKHFTYFLGANSKFLSGDDKMTSGKFLSGDDKMISGKFLSGDDKMTSGKFLP